jgi:hypothetical protein
MVSLSTLVLEVAAEHTTTTATASDSPVAPILRATTGLCASCGCLKGDSPATFTAKSSLGSSMLMPKSRAVGREARDCAPARPRVRRPLPPPALLLAAALLAASFLQCKQFRSRHIRYFAVYAYSAM